MKKLHFLIMVLSFVMINSSLWAQSCTKSITTKITIGEAARLCEGSGSTGPAECYNFAGESFSQLSMGLLVGLCRGAESIAPVDCLLGVVDLKLTVGLAVTLCAKATSSYPADCYKGQSRMTVGSAVKSCKENTYSVGSSPFDWGVDED